MNEYAEYVGNVGTIGLVVFLIATAFVPPFAAFVVGLGSALAAVLLDLAKVGWLTSYLFFSTQALRTNPEYKRAVVLET